MSKLSRRSLLRAGMSVAAAPLLLYCAPAEPAAAPAAGSAAAPTGAAAATGAATPAVTGAAATGAAATAAAPGGTAAPASAAAAPATTPAGGAPAGAATPTAAAAPQSTPGGASQGGGTVRADHIVVGAGIAGIAAARALRDKGGSVIVLEANAWIGGRLSTDTTTLGIPFDLGAAWIHGPDGGNPITPLARAASLRTFLTSDDSLEVRAEDGSEIGAAALDAGLKEYSALIQQVRPYMEQRPDMSYADALKAIDGATFQKPFIQWALSAVLEFNAGGPIEQLSARHGRDDSVFPGKDVIMVDGYEGLARSLASGLDIRTGKVATSVTYEGQSVSVRTSGGETFTANDVIVAVPLGVLQKGTITFTPALPAEKVAAIRRQRFGNVNKVALAFDRAFWPTDTQYIGYMAPVKGQYTYFVNAKTFSGANALVTFGFGNYAETIEGQSDQQVVGDAMRALRAMFAGAPDPARVLITRWRRAQNIGGGYAFTAVGGSNEDNAIVAAAVGERLAFAGEHTSPQYKGTVHGAYLSGQAAAKALTG